MASVVASFITLDDVLSCPGDVYITDKSVAVLKEVASQRSLASDFRVNFHLFYRILIAVTVAVEEAYSVSLRH